MAVVTETELTNPQRENVKKAKLADQVKNYDYAIALLAQVLKETPQFLSGRQLLREICIKKASSGSKTLRSLNSMAATPTLLKAQNAIKKNPAETMVLVEQVLANDPFNKQANELLSHAAQNLEMLETASLAHETLRKANPKDIKNLHALGELYLRLKDPRAREVYESIINIKPTDGEALSGLKNAEAVGSMMRGGWDAAKSYRDIIADKDVAQQLEQASKIIKSDEAIDSLIEEIMVQHQAEPTNVLHVKRIAELYRQKGDFENAAAYYQYAYELTGKTDPGLEKIIYDLRLAEFSRSISEWEEFAVANPDHPEREQHLQTLADIRAQKNQLILSECRGRVAKYPNDLQFRFELGEALYNAGDISGAIPELQSALRQPSVRMRAMLLLSLCFKAKGQLDIAARRLEEAAAEIISMDDIKKNILYNLGIIFEEMKQPEKALNAFKEIYEVDYGYRDVAQRVEEAYKKGA